jgi:signal peptidase I
MKKKEVLQLIIVLIIGVFLVNILIPFFTGSEKPMIVLSGSMVPFFLPGDIIIIKPIDPSEYKVGDVMTFQAPGNKPGTFISHRIIFIEEGKQRLFQTKGDANNAEDDFKILASHAIGKLIFVLPFVGYIPDFVKTNKIIYILMLFLPLSLLFLDEIKKIILYSNPARARRLEHQLKKTKRRTSYNINGKRLTAIILISGIIFSGLVLFNLGENGSAILEREKKIDYSGFLPIVYIVTPDNSVQMLDIQPWYGVIFETNNSLITPQNTHVSQKNENLITAPEGTPVQISTAPYILPVFWITALAGVNPYLPAVTEILVYTSIVVLIMRPFWYKKSIKGRHKKRFRFKKLFAEWKRALLF